MYRCSTWPKGCFIFRTVPQLGLERISPELACSESELDSKVSVLPYPLPPLPLLARLCLVRSGFGFNFVVDGPVQGSQADMAGVISRLRRGSVLTLRALPFLQLLAASCSRQLWGERRPRLPWPATSCVTLPVEKFKPRVSPKLMSKSKSRLVGAGTGCLGVEEERAVSGIPTVGVVVEDELCGEERGASWAILRG